MRFVDWWERDFQSKQLNPASRENNCVRVGRIASLSADKGQLSSRETTRIRFGKAGAHPQLAWESQLPLKPYPSLQSFHFKRQLRFFRFALRCLFPFMVQFDLLSKCGLLAHTSAAFLKNCCTEKLLFACGLWLKTLLLGKTPESGSARLGHIPSLPWESQLPLKPCISLQPFNF